MILSAKFARWMLLVIVKMVLVMGHSLPSIINELNERLIISTNFIFCKHVDKFIPLETPISRFLYTSLEAFNITNFKNHLGGDNKLFIIMGNEPPYDLFKKLQLRFQLADFLLVIDKKINEEKWKPFINFAWRLGYAKFLIHSMYDGISYDKIIFPKLRIRETNVRDYAKVRDTFQNVDGYKVRVAAYNSVPRSFIYLDASGKEVHAGYYMRFARAFLESRNATFQPVYTPNDSPESCTQFILNNTVDICADALVQNSEVFTVTKEVRLSTANVIVPHARPLRSYRYLTAPFKTKVWFILALYVLLIAAFMSLILWIKGGRWDFSHALLEVFSSLLYSGFHLKAIHGRERYILFGVLFISGFVYSTMYLGLLKSMLISEVFEKQIETFEELAERNIPLLIDSYDRQLFMKYHVPKTLWSVVRTVSSETLLNHRNNFDQDYAYVLFSDRLDMFNYAQQYLRHPKFRRIPIDFCFLFAGFPMSRKWFLKHHLSRAWMYGFESGMLDKMAEDTYREAVFQGYLNLPITEHLEAKPLDLNYFIIPTISLALGYSLALLSFGIEVLTWKIRNRNMKC
ncbi:uncharacterized protein LOC108029854 [Drosophila biarmipes]|uniref:uncharacterized protein LOC108029854 n=1 Tax=Drosophila biarmipes TaxID=125945 RepID=UPI001CDB1E1D|nr:uncharacterized protein LOC108029854 [Drosophila biarmipes]